MKRSLKMKCLIVLTIIVMMLTLNTVVNAAEQNYSVGMSLTTSSKLKAGDTVTINVNLTDINAGEGIDTITAALNYDTNVFEDVTTENITASNNWTPSYAASSKMLTLLKNSKVTSPETVLTITLKVRDVINVNSTTVTLKEITVSGGRVTDNGTGDISVNDASVTLAGDAITPTTPTTNTTTSNTTSNTTTSNTTTNAIKDKTTTTATTLPKTGIAQYSIIAIVVVAIIATASYIAYKKIAKDVK